MAEDYSHIDELILSFLKGEISFKEKKSLMDWIAESSSNKSYFQQHYKIWNAAALAENSDAEIEGVLQKVKFKLNSSVEGCEESKKSIKLYQNLGKWAAVVLVSLVTGALINHFAGLKASSGFNALNEINVPMGSKSTVHLPDGTVVTLNAGSKLTYSVEYGKHLREVDLEGEGYFKVAKLKEKPFIVHTSKANIKALGTEFNVKAYPEENIIETILVEGSVVINELKDNKVKDNEGVILKPGQKLQIFKNTELTAEKPNEEKNIQEEQKLSPKTTRVVMKSSDLQVETSWKDKRWIVKSIDIENLAVLLSRKFNVNITLKNPELKKYKFSGTIENETLEQVFEIMKYTVPVSYTIERGEVTLMINKNLEKDYKEAY